MNRQELHDLLTGDLGLLPEPVANNVSRTYFHKVVEWHPQRNTRVFCVLFDPNGEPSRVKLCASSDNNNAVLIEQPFDKLALAKAAASEIKLIEHRQQIQAAR